MVVRNITVLILTFLLAGCASAVNQHNLIGDWSGTLNLGGGSLRLIFHITELENGYAATIESVDQQGMMIPTEIEVDGDSITFVVEQIDVEYSAIISGNQMVGTFNQFGMSMPDFTVSRIE